MSRRRAPIQGWVPFFHTLFRNKKKEHSENISSYNREAVLLDLRLRSIMVPRSDVISVNHSASLEEVQHLLLSNHFEALPVFQETLDRIVGLIDCHGILKALEEKKKEWISEVKPALFAASSMPLLEAIIEMQKQDAPFILIVDEYGGIDGLVSRDNILMAFLHHFKPLDDPQEIEVVSYREDGAPLLDGRLSLHEFKDILGTESFEWKDGIDDEIETVGGLVCHLAGRVPLKGEIISHPSGFAFEIIDAEPRKIKRLSVRLPQKAQDFHEADTRAL